MTQYPNLFAALAAPFAPDEVKVRTGHNGRQLHYITARTAMNRLDSVLGPENWWDEYLPLEKSVLCKLSIRLRDGQIITKCDTGGYAGMADQGDDDKSGFSDAFKRAAAKFGVARYLYRDGVPSFARDREPVLPTDAMVSHAGPSPSGASESPLSRPESTSDVVRLEPGKIPRTGKALFAWTKEQEQRYEVRLLKYLNSWAKLQGFPARMIDWDPDQVGLGYSEACRKLESLQPARVEALAEALSN
jgi:hypothetical protein